MSTLINSLVFDLQGSLITSQGVVPNFSRDTTANAEYKINGSLRLVAAPSGLPRFSSTGALFLEKGATNYLPYSNEFAATGWIKGSAWSILKDRVVDLHGNYTGDRASVNFTLGNDAEQTLYRDIELASGQTYTFTAYLRLAGGQFSPNDRIYVSGDVVAPQSVYLGQALNELPGNYLPLSFTFTTAGTAPVDAFAEDLERVIRVNFFVEAAVSFDIAGAQVESGSLRTTLISPEGDSSPIVSRDGDILTYPDSPVVGLDAFVFYASLDRWSGDGAIATAGTFAVAIANGALTASAGAVVVTDPDPLPSAAVVCVRVSSGLERLNIYVNGVLKASEVLSSYVGNQANLSVSTGEGSREFRCLYFFNQDLGDGAIAVGGSVGSILGTLHNQDVLFSDVTEGFGRISLPSVLIAAKNKALFKMPEVRQSAQVIQRVDPGAGAVAQVMRVRVENVAVGVPQRDWVMVNTSKLEYTTDNTPTAAEMAAGLTTMINSNPKLEKVTASYTATNTYFDITADVEGDPFDVFVSENLVVEKITDNVLQPVTITVTAAVDFALGRATIYDDNAFIVDAAITNVDPGTNKLTIEIELNSDSGRLDVGQVISQPRWEMLLSQNAYFVHHLEDHPDVKVSHKGAGYFSLENLGEADRVVTPYVKISL